MPPERRCGGRKDAGAMSSAKLKVGEGLLWRLGNGEERIELRQLEQRAEIVIQAREAELAACLANPLGDGHECAQTGGIDVAGPRKIDEEAALASLQGGLDQVLQ